MGPEETITQQRVFSRGVPVRTLVRLSPEEASPSSRKMSKVRDQIRVWYKVQFKMAWFADSWSLTKEYPSS